VAKTVYDLWFEREYSDREDTELHIGVYATEDDAKAASERLKQKPGFCEFPEGFSIYERQLGMTSWQYGFITKFEARFASDYRPIAFDLPAFEELMAPDEPPANDQ
jgi:hypothetical protein